MQLAHPLKSLYIIPNLFLFPDLAEFNKPQDGKDYSVRLQQDGDLDFSSLLHYTRLMVLAEPGYGKSELTDRIKKNHAKSGCLKLNCKELRNQTIPEFIEHQEYTGGPLKYLLLDALDEVERLYLGKTIDHIQGYTDSNPEITIVITCRQHYMSRYAAYFQNLSAFRFLKINPFVDSDIRKYLTYYLPGEEPAIDKIIEKARVDSYRSILSTPRYLEAFVSAIENDSIKVSDLPTLKLKDLFEKLIYHKLENDANQQSEKFSKNEIELTKRVLEKLSLIMEIYQTNSITKEDLITVLDETVSNINLIFLNYSNIDTFIERILKQTEDVLEFEHTQFQEYLAAKQVIRLANSEQALYDLILDPDLEQIHSSWYDVLKFAAEIEPGILMNLTQHLGYKQNYQVDEKLIDIILSVDETKLSEVQKALLFTTLTNFYQKSGQGVGRRYHRVARFFSRVYNATYVQLAVDESTDYRIFGNRIDIIRGIAGLGQLSPDLSQVWCDLLITRFADPVFDGQSDSISFVLEALDAYGELQALWPAITGRIDKVLESYLLTLLRMDPENEFSWEVLQYVISFRSNLDISDYLNKLTGSKNLHSLFDFLLAAEKNRNDAFRGSSSYKAFHQLFGHISDQQDEGLEVKVAHVFSWLLNRLDHYHLFGTKKQFADQALTYFLGGEPEFLSQLLALPDSQYLIREYSDVFADHMDMAQFRKLREILIVTGENWTLRTLTAKLNIQGDLERRALLAEIQGEFPELFVIQNPQPIAVIDDTANEDAVYRQYQGYLNLAATNYIVQDIFAFIYQNSTLLLQRSTLSEIEQVKVLLTKTLDDLDPQNFVLQITRQGNRSSYSHTDDDWFRFDLLINLAQLLGLNEVIGKYRMKIIYHLPMIDNYVSNAAKLSGILQQIAPITNAEVKALLDFCLARNDDYIYASIHTFIDLIRDQDLAAFSPVLQIFIEAAAEKTDFNEKGKAMDAYAYVTRNTGRGKKYLQKLFKEQAGDTKGAMFIKQQANAHLISVYDDDEAIDWRIDELKKRIMPVDENVVTLSRSINYTPQMTEMERPTFNKCFNENPSKKLEKPMFGLLEFAFDLRKQPDCIRYSNYLQLIAYEYFDAIKSVPLINRLRSLVTAERFGQRGYSFKYLLKRLELSYIDAKQSFGNISEAVQLYNELSAKKYVRIRDEADLVRLLNIVITEDVRNVIENEGFYHVAQRLVGNISHKGSGHIDEDMIQRTLKLIFENALLKRGLRSVDIHREEETMDGKRYDYLIKYGFIGPIVVELKRLDNDEITNPRKRKAYKEKLHQYLYAANSRNGYYLIFKVLEDIGDKHKKQFEQLISEYSDIKGMNIELLDCWEPAKNTLANIAAKVNKPAAPADSKP